MTKFNSDYGVCRKEVTSRSTVVACERCDDWFRVGCAVMRGLKDSHMKLLQSRNLLCVCNHCLDIVRREWKKEVQNEDDELGDGATRDTAEVSSNNSSDVVEDTGDLEKDEETKELERDHTYFRDGKNSRYVGGGRH